MEWSDAGFVLGGRRHGEHALIAELLTRENGRCFGLVRGGQSPRLRAVLQPGNLVAATWRGRLPEHLGLRTCELVRGYAARLLDDASRLAALGAAVSLLTLSLPEREPHPDVFAGFMSLIDALDSAPDWAAHYVHWECALLAALGFGLDLSRSDWRDDRPRLCLAPYRSRGIARGGSALPRQAIAVACVFVARQTGGARGDRGGAAHDPIFFGAPCARTPGSRAARRPRPAGRLLLGRRRSC